MWPSSPCIGYHDPKTSSLLQGQIRELADTGKKRKSRASVVDPSAAKKSKKQPAKPDVGETLDEAEIEKAIDEAAVELSDVGEKTPLASPAPKKTPPTLAAPTVFSRQPRKKRPSEKKKPAPAPTKPTLRTSTPPLPPSPQPQPISSAHTPSAVGSHHIEEEE